MANPEPVWTYRGYQLKPSEFTTAMVHLFRAEISRANIWRVRLDTTTNWAVVTTGAMISFAFSGEASHHGIILLNVLLVTIFLAIETRRYRYYDLWSSRVRLMETDFFAPMLVPPFSPSSDWAESLAENLLQPHFSISFAEAVGRRLRRNYIWIYLILGLAWIVYLYIHPQDPRSLEEYFNRAGISVVPGTIVIAAAFLFFLGLAAFALYSRRLHEASGEVLPRYETTGGVEAQEDARKVGRWQAWFRHGQRRQQLLAILITKQPQLVAERILQEMKRGVTGMPGTGMYTGESNTVLLCALTVTEVEHLKSIVKETDPGAFVIVAPTQEVLGKGFGELDGQPVVDRRP